MFRKKTRGQVIGAELQEGFSHLGTAVAEASRAVAEELGPRVEAAQKAAARKAAQKEAAAQQKAGREQRAAARREAQQQAAVQQQAAQQPAAGPGRPGRHDAQTTGMAPGANGQLPPGAVPPGAVHSGEKGRGGPRH